MIPGDPARLPDPERMWMHASTRLLPLAAVLAAVGLASPVSAQVRQATALRTDAPPRIDGLLDDAAWAAAEPAADFVQREPDEGAPSPERTEVRFLYDDEAIYIGARMFSADPDAIRALVERRDRETPTERILISFDTYQDRRTAYSFEVNAAGVRSDGETR